jgi:hypothetical protein
MRLISWTLRCGSKQPQLAIVLLAVIFGVAETALLHCSPTDYTL